MNIALNSSAVNRWTQQFWTSCYFKFILPHIERAHIYGVHLDVSVLSPKIRNRILNVGYEDAERRVCQDLLTSSDTVLELGGGIGLVGLFCQLKLGIKKYITVEANPATVEVLKKNYELNGVVPVVWNLALGRADGVISLDVAGDFWEHHTTESHNSKNVVVQSATLESLLARAGSEITTLIIDVEGAEAFIDFSTLPQHVRKIIIEVHQQQLGEQGVKRLFSGVRSQGFRTAQCHGDTFGFVRN